MAATRDPGLLEQVRRHARPLHRTAPDAPLLRSAAAHRLVLIGEASHGTHEFYAFRADFTQQLIEHHGCRAVVIEGDWPDTWRVNRWVRGLDGGTPEDALGGFQRFPTWMWRNTVVRDFILWLRAFNIGRAPWEQCGVYGMDLYSLFGSVRAVLQYLDRADPEAARRARRRYACFDHFQQDLQAYGYAAGFGAGVSCENAVLAQLRDLMEQRAPHDGDPDALFHAQQNAKLVHDAEQYYRSMFRGRASSWNLRDLHMVDTLQALQGHLHERTGSAPRMAVWAHNSHLGDASATQMHEQGEWNVGELVRQRWGGDAFLVGATTYEGTVRAASEWDEPGEVKQVRPGLAGSWEALFHDTGLADFVLEPHADASLRHLLDLPLLERAIGVIYLPASERHSHYFDARLGAQFDAIVHLDRTRALEPIADGAPLEGMEIPETFPEGT